MNIELQVKMLYANADKLDEAGFVVDFYYIAKEYARQQNLQQTVCTTPLEALEQMLSKVEKAKPSPFRLIAYEKWESQVRNLRGAIQLIKDCQPMA